MTALGTYFKRFVLRAYLALARIYPYAMSSPLARQLNLVLLDLGHRGLGVGNYESPSGSGEQYFIDQVLPRLLPYDVPVLVDVGANNGEFAAMLAARFPSARIWAFEPHPVTAGSTRARLTGLAVVEQFAVGESAGRLTIWDYAESDGSPHASVFREAIADLRDSEPIGHEVDVVTLDAWSAERAVTTIDFLKIDTEGNELAVLRGAGDLLAAGGIGVIQFEFNEMNVYSRSFLRDFAEILDGYELYRLLPRGMAHLHPYVAGHHEIFAFQNVVGIRRDLVRAGGGPWADRRTFETGVAGQADHPPR